MAVAQTDLADWLIGQGRSSEATARIEEAVPALTALGARPALERAVALAPEGRATVPASH